MDLIETLFKQSPIAEWSTHLSQQGHRHLLTGLVGSAKTVLLAGLFKQRKEPLLIITNDLYHMQQLADDLENLISPQEICQFPVEEILAAEISTSSPDFKEQRICALNALVEKKHKIILTTTSGLRRILPNPQDWSKYQLTFNLGEEIDLGSVEKNLVSMGYIRQKLVDRPGDFAVRGSILDIYPLNMDNPVRIDLFDTEIDSLRTFNTASQKSIENIEKVTISPATDFIASKEQLQNASELISKTFYQEKQSLIKKDDRLNLEKKIQEVISLWNNGELVAKHLPFAEYIYPKQDGILNYLVEDSLVVVDDYARILEKEQDLVLDDQNWLVNKLEKNELFPEIVWSKEIQPIIKNCLQKQVFLAPFSKGMGGLRFSQKLDIKARSVQRFFGQMPLLKTEADRWKKQQQTVIILVPEQERIDKVTRMLDDFSIPAILTTANSLQKNVIQVAKGALKTGFELAQGHIIVLTEHELFAQATKRQAQRQTMSNTQRLKSYTDLKKGDFVVHVNHGIGQYLGMETMKIDGKHQDYMTLLYADDAKLFIPVTQLNRIQKYVSSESKTPRINNLSNDKWLKTKKKVASKIEDIADDLVDLYAKRESEKGFAFSLDDAYQKEFEDAFPYTETPDQLRSAKEIKHDMELSRPMDRLLIGDVGFGKTEVALRAAFKAIQDGKQVAFLAPTTVLAQQHYDTLMTRFDNFSVSIGVLSRFSTKKQVDKILQDLRLGLIDIIVGTHRLLSKDIKFADLGLLIVDEEQRFGVKHKERLKELKATVDVLTLTATPIPRTLNLSMLGVRDLSVIETAPMNRYPIQTYVLEQNFGVIVDGIRREMARGGQTFYLHNRIDDIERVVNELHSLVPEARVAYIHGRMSEVQLERILIDFIAGEYDVLVTTTIIETGVDIPNANTLFVEEADHMGLAQLYQLRGRVGRSNRVAYAYFMYQPDKVLTEVSEKRLEAIKDFTELGSGFKIAMRDLSIRGAGNILGKQQHGFIDSVGYDLYTQMLNEAVARKQGKKIQAKSDTEINLDIEAYLPAEYIEDQRQKIEIYKRIRQFENIEQYREVQADLIDRFGDYPQEVANLLEIGLLKLYADFALINRIKQNGNKIVVQLSKKTTSQLPAKELLRAVAQTTFPATLGIKDECMQIDLTVQPTMSKQDIIEQLQILTKVLFDQMHARTAKKEKVSNE